MKRKLLLSVLITFSQFLTQENLWSQTSSTTDLPSNISSKPPFSITISSLIESQEEEELLNLEDEILSLEVYYKFPLNLLDINPRDIDNFFFLSEREKEILLNLARSKKANSDIPLNEIENILGQDNYVLLSYFIDFADRLKRERVEADTIQSKVNYNLGLKNNQVENWDFSRNTKIEDAQIRGDVLGYVIKDSFRFDYYLLLEKDRLEKNFPQFFKLGLAFSFLETGLYYGALNLDINQNLLFSTKNNTFSTFLPERGGFRSASRMGLSRSKSEIYFNGLGVKSSFKSDFTRGLENLTLFIWGGSYAYHIETTALDPVYPHLRHATKHNYNEEPNFPNNFFLDNGDSLQEKIVGVYLEYLFPNLKLSGGLLASLFNHPIIDNISETEKIYGKNSLGVTWGWNYLNPYFIWYGEFSSLIKEDHKDNIYSDSNKKLFYSPALVTGIRIFEENLFGTVVLRILDKDYQALHNNHYTAFSDKKNELGIYSALSGRVESLRFKLILDYADRIYDSQEFLFTTRFNLDWNISSGAYLKVDLFSRNNLDRSDLRVILIKGYKGRFSNGSTGGSTNKWEIFWKNNLPLYTNSFNLLSEVNLIFQLSSLYSTRVKLGWGREEQTTLSFPFFYNTLFLDFIHLRNDSLWLTLQNNFSLPYLPGLKLNLSLGTIWRTDETRNYIADSLENDFFFSAVLSVEVGG